MHPRSPRARVVAALLLVTSFLAPAVVAGAANETSAPSTSAPSNAAQRQAEIEQRIRELNDAMGEASAEEARLLRSLRDTQSQLDDYDATIASIDAQLGPANDRLAQAQAQVSALDGRYLELTRQLRDTNRRIDVTQQQVAGVAAELYRRAGGDRAGALTALVLDARSPHEIVAGTRYLTNAAENGRRQIDRLDALRDQVSTLRDALEHQRDQARAARDVVAQERARIADLKGRQERARSEVAAVVAKQQDVLDQIQAKKSTFNAEIEALKAESNSIAAMLRSRQSGQGTAPTGRGILSYPVNAPITSPFGMRHHPILGVTRMHTGIDFGAGTGTPIRAAADGDVAWAGPRGGYGNAVIIDHGNSLATLYAHQSRIAVSVGQHVDRGQVIGYVGSTGLATGPHLHFEVRVRGNPVDPMQYL